MRLEECEFEVSLGYIARPCLKKKKKPKTVNLIKVYYICMEISQQNPFVPLYAKKEKKKKMCILLSLSIVQSNKCM
jgi:hypothetical protein